MTGKRSKRLNSALLPLGVLALVAGCGGGGAMSTPGGGTTYIPPAGKQMTTATLHLLVPGRRPASASRRPQYVSAGTSRVDVSAVAAGAASPWPIATSTSIPTPGPLASGASPTPIPVTMTVPVPAATDQFMVNTYDTGGYLLSGLTTGPTTISANGSTAVNLQLNAAANCVTINGAVGSLTMTPLENQASAQTATFTIQPCDIDGYAIPAGQSLANVIEFATPAPANVTVSSSHRNKLGAGPSPTPLPSAGPGSLTFSPATITTGGSQTVTITYPKNASSPASYQAVPSPYPSPAAAAVGTFPQITVDPLYYVLVAHAGSPGPVDVVVHDAQNITMPLSLGFLNTLQGLNSGPIASEPSMFGCANAGQAILPTQGYLNTITIPNPTAAVPTPMPVVSTVSDSTWNPVAAAMDLACNAYVGDSNGYLFSGTLGSGLSQAGGPYSNQLPSPAGYMLPISGIATAQGIPYVGFGAASGYFSNINTASGIDTGVGPAVSVMSNVSSTGQVAVAFLPGGGSGGDYTIGRWTPPATSLDYSATLPATSGYGITGVAIDPKGVVWATDTGGRIWKYDPASAGAVSYSLGHYQPSSMTIASDGMIFVTDSAYNVIDMYSSTSIGGTSPPQHGSNYAQILNTTSVQAAPSGVTVVP